MGEERSTGTSFALSTAGSQPHPVGLPTGQALPGAGVLHRVQAPESAVSLRPSVSSKLTLGLGISGLCLFFLILSRAVRTFRSVLFYSTNGHVLSPPVFLLDRWAQPPRGQAILAASFPRPILGTPPHLRSESFQQSAAESYAGGHYTSHELI